MSDSETALLIEVLVAGSLGGLPPWWARRCADALGVDGLGVDGLAVSLGPDAGAAELMLFSD
ncbi:MULTISPECIES: hypothetical protein [Streptacidiphilus]|uniref:Uncharacterized protein n=1 Tax=Streptacidiphilus cavernicola TaxID=3342716 RepID=A0ABV6UP51_9ACTN|nr:hypothetical protein [Streptacidiphilus jeojiense]